MLKRLVSKYFDYEIVGHYYGMVPQANGHYVFKKHYIKRYSLKCINKWKQKVKKYGKRI